MLSHWAGMLESLGQPIVAAVGWEVACSGEGGEEASEQHTHAQVEKQPALLSPPSTSEHSALAHEYIHHSLDTTALFTHKCADAPFQV